MTHATSHAAMTLTTAIFGALCGSTALAGDRETNELERRLDQQAKEIQQLRESIDMASELLEEQSKSAGTGRRDGNISVGKTTIGGYGELHYTNLDSKKEMDFHRAVLFVGHEFDAQTRFFMEWDLEHASEMDLEQAYLEFDLNDSTRALAGVMLMPFGIVNETHEPPTFYGVERNPVETKIIPTTWREGGGALAGRFGQGWSYDLFLTSGLKLSSAKDYAVRDGRQKVAKAVAEDLAYSGRIKWTGLPGLELAASYLYQTDATQGLDPNAGSTSLIETHAVFTRGQATLKALYARWSLDGDGPKAVGADRQTGWYIEPSYKLTQKLGLFARYNKWDNSAGSAGADSEVSQGELGVNYWPIDNVVLKVDAMQQDGAQDDQGFNLGIGYLF